MVGLILAAVLGLVASVSAVPCVPPGYSLETVVGPPLTGEPVGFARLPDGRVLLIERETGVVRLSAVGVSTSAVILTVPGVNADFAERGLLGIAVDPAWPTRPYVYVYATRTTGFCHLTMYEAGGALTDSTSTAVTLANPYELLTDIPDVNVNHNAGALRFGPDGKLFVAVGDDGFSCLSQDLTTPHGKVLRLDVSSMPGVGSGPPPKSDLTPNDNPFPGPDPTEQLVYVWGLRNPYRFTIDAPTGDLFVGSVGSAHYEEVNHVPAIGGPGDNFGWPQFEGPQELGCCGDCGDGNVFTEAIHVLQHPAQGFVSIVGGPVMREVVGSSVSFPSTTDGDLFFAEFFTGDLYRLTESAGSWSLLPGACDSSAWGTGFAGATDLQLGPEGALWIASLGFVPEFPAGVYRIVHEDVTAAPLDAGGTTSAAALRVTPNPVRLGTDVSFTSTELRLRGGVGEIFDLHGRRVRRLGVSDDVRFRWDGRGDDGRLVAPGAYFVRVRTERASETSRLVVLPE